MENVKKKKKGFETIVFFFFFFGTETKLGCSLYGSLNNLTIFHVRTKK